MADTQQKRTRLFVDKHVQGGLLLRVTGYWFFCLLTISLLVLCWSVITGPRAPASVTMGRVFHNYLPALIASLLLLPLVLIDCNRFSNRFVGPILRFRRQLRALADGNEVAPIKFRPKDFLHDLAEQFNRLRATVPTPAASTDPDRDEPASPVEADADGAETETARASLAKMDDCELEVETAAAC